jgi:DNA (cytosine-5)-methyltransferase 1
LDLFCGAGGASVGYARAGFEVVGVDIAPQPNYPFTFYQDDAMTFRLDGFDAIHASPPCQLYSALKVKTTKDWPDLIAPTRERLRAAGVPYVIENVMPAPLLGGVVLCGSMFGLRTHRHRRFETPWLILQPTLHEHGTPIPRTTTRKRRKDYADGSFISVTGDVGSYVGPTAMGIDWMTGNELSEAIPPAYTEFIGRELMGVATCPTR